MKWSFLFLLFCLVPAVAWADDDEYGLQVEVERVGEVYTLAARFNTSLGQCAAYRFLTDYDAATELPGVVESTAARQSDNIVQVDRTADEHVLFFNIRLHSIMEYTERPDTGIAFRQLHGDSRMFQGSWTVIAQPKGSTFEFKGRWEPDTVIPLFVIDYFAEHRLADKFNAMADLAEKHKDGLSESCMDRQQLTQLAIPN